ncbi:MAG: hypothetical protein IH623_13280 [Verrucomicrobia bacterium]|nr:hypothetical protein [Verrucomicrobiota bacterium]
MYTILKTTKACLLAATVGWVLNSASAQPLIHFPFNEGTGPTVTDTASGLVGTMGTQQDPVADAVVLSDTSPSGLGGDRSITTSGNGFLVADDSASRALNITNGPITIECWLNINGAFFKPNEGIVAYGGSYKMGMRGGFHVFTLYGIADITNSAAGAMPVDQWLHLAAAWEPGVGVHFYVNGVSNFTAHTAPGARPTLHNYLSIASEGLGNNVVGSLDRVRIHNALLTADQLDTDAANPKPVTANTIVNYSFNEAAFPSMNSLSPSLPTMQSSTFLPEITSPVWTNDTPTGLAGDYALAFLTERPPVFESAFAPDSGGVIDLDANGTNYTLQAWVKLPTGPMEDRRVIYFTGGAAPRASLSINANRALHSTLYGNTDFASSVIVPNDGRWHHVAVVMEDFLRMRFYLDGVLRQTVNRTATGALGSTTTPGITIGKESDTRYFRGLLDRVMIHNVALTNSTLDYPAIPGLPTFDSLAAHPASVAANLGATVTFTATPTSASPATYQWRYRTNLADQTSIALPGETGLTLTLDNITPEQLGYYFLAVTNTVGASESYAARLSLPVNLEAKLFDFETPTYVSGLLKDQDGWSNDFNDNAVRVLTDTEIADVLTATGRTPGQTVHGGSQALLITGPALATTSIRSITGFETEQNVTLDVWVRPLSAAAGNAIGNIFLTMENAVGTRAAAFRIGPLLSIDYGSAITGVWQATGLVADPDTWYHITMSLDYTARTYDFYVDDVKVNSDPIPFYTATSDSFRQIRIFRGANQAGMIVDDLNVTGPATEPELGIRLGDGVLIISWPASATDYELKSAATVTGPYSDTVPHTTVGDENQAVIQPTGDSRYFRLVK